MSSTTIRRSFLEPALDARALNLRQEDDVEQLLELEITLRSTSPLPARSQTLLDALAAWTRRLAEENTDEGRRELSIAGTADRLTHDLRDRELNGKMRNALTGKAIARRLREPLRLLCDLDLPQQVVLVDACRKVAEALAQLPAAQVLSPAVAHELGRDRFDLLSRLCTPNEGGGGPILPARAAAARKAKK